MKLEIPWKTRIRLSIRCEDCNTIPVYVTRNLEPEDGEPETLDVPVTCDDCGEELTVGLERCRTYEDTVDRLARFGKVMDRSLKLSEEGGADE